MQPSENPDNQIDRRTITNIDGNKAHQYYSDANQPEISPSDVLQSYTGSFHFKAEDFEEGIKGLRNPQVGALHSIIGHWTLDDSKLATVVMPTGTGKTETMLAIFCSQQISKLLVIVPSDALREQIAAKFETLGKLPELGILAGDFHRPIVGKIQHKFINTVAAKGFAQACNVIISTPTAIMESDEATRKALFRECSHLFIDEAHHSGASTWQQIREEFHDKPVIQFTATPYRQDGIKVGGKIIYNFPLRQAQKEGYFSEIDYVPITSFNEADNDIADKAIEILDRDIENGFDHLVMARTKTITKAKDLVKLYQDKAPGHNPVIIYSSMPVSEKKAALNALTKRRSRIIVCVDMLGEGFDLPSLKIAAIHDTHKSLGVTLQFVGRFARVSGITIGKATVIVNRLDSQRDQRLQELYVEDTDWNSIIHELSAQAIAEEQELSEFEQAFATLPEGVSLKNLAPKMSTVAYKTQTTQWYPEKIAEYYNKKLYTKPIAVNHQEHVMWFVTRENMPVTWGDIKSIEDTSYNLYIYYWDKENNMLYVNSSSNDGMYEEQAKLLCGESVERLKGINVFRTMATLARRVPTNVGMLDILSHGNRFQMNVGSNVSEGFTDAARRNKTQTNIFAHGYEEKSGQKFSVGASIKGRIWSHKAALNLKDWMKWCQFIGIKLKDDSIEIESVLHGFIIPKPLEAHPGLVPLMLEWPTELYLNTSETMEISFDGNKWPLIDSDLVIKRFESNNPIEFAVVTPHGESKYKITLAGGKMNFSPLGSQASLQKGRESISIGDYLNKNGLRVLFEKQTILEPDMILLQPNDEVSAYGKDKLVTLDWTGIDIRNESQGANHDQTSIQARMIRQLESQDWDIIIDDDGSGETADLVAIKSVGNSLKVGLVHCKFSHDDTPGARVIDLYEVCGQAQKSTARLRKPGRMLKNLIRRETARQKDGRNNLLKGTEEELFNISEKADRLITDFEIMIVQPGVSKASVSVPQLELIAATESYVSDTSGGAKLTVFVSE